MFGAYISETWPGQETLKTWGRETFFTYFFKKIFIRVNGRVCVAY